MKSKGIPRERRLEAKVKGRKVVEGRAGGGGGGGDKRWVRLMASGNGEYPGDGVVPCFASGWLHQPLRAQSLLGWFQHLFHAWPWRGSDLQSPHKAAAPD